MPPDPHPQKLLEHEAPAGDYLDGPRSPEKPDGIALSWFFMAACGLGGLERNAEPRGLPPWHDIPEGVNGSRIVSVETVHQRTPHSRRRQRASERSLLRWYSETDEVP